MSGNYPTPSPTPGIAPPQPTPPAPPLNPDGTPVLSAPANGVGVLGTSTIFDWIYPDGLDPTKANIWYDITKVPARTVTRTEPVPYNSSGDISVLGGTTTTTRTIKAHTKDNNVTPEQLMNTIAAMQQMDPKGFLAIQTYLSSGVWGTVHVNGTFDHDTEVALGNAMLQWLKWTRNTEVPTVDFQEYLRTAGIKALQLQQQSSGSAASPIAVTDPDTIMAQAQQAAQNALGHTLSQDELSKFVSEFQGAQTTYQTATGGTVSAPDLNVEADKFVQAGHPQQFKQQNQQAYFDQLVNMLTTGARRPDQQPVAPVS